MLLAMEPPSVTDPLVAALLDALKRFGDWATEQLDLGAEEIFRGLINLVRSASFVTRTDLGLVNSLSSLIGWNQVAPLVDAVLRLGLLLAAAAYVGHAYFGWPGLGESVQRWGAALILTRLSWQLQDWSLQEFSDLTSGLAVSIPDFPNLEGLNPFVLVVLMLVWTWLLFLLALVCAERIAWLVVLKPIGPLAFLTWVHHKSAWVASMYVRVWIGWLVGQFLVVLAIAAMVQMINRGGIEGYFLSCACLIVARKAISMLVPTGGEGIVKVGPIRLG